MPRAERADPPYVQVMDHLRGRILDGTLTEGERLPSIGDLAEEWGISYATAGKAFSQLQIEGYIRTSPRGSFVEPLTAGSATPQDRMRRLRRTGSSDSAAELQIVRFAELIRPPVYVADLMDTDPAGQVIRREFVTIAGRRPRAEPVALTVHWLPPQLATDLPDLLETRPVPRMEARIEQVAGKILVHGEDHLHAREADAREASALGLKIGTPILAVAHLKHCADGDVLLYEEFCLPPRRTLRYDYDIEGSTPSE